LTRLSPESQEYTSAATRTDKMVNQDCNWRKRFALLDFPSQAINYLQNQYMELKQLRYTIATKMLPIGIGCTSWQEYQSFLLGALDEHGAKNNKIYAEDFLSFQIKQKYQTQLGARFNSIWAVVKEIVVRNKRKEEQGITAQLPRSAQQIAKDYLFNLAEGKIVIEILSQLPQSPAEDLLAFRRQSKRLKAKLTPKRVEFKVSSNQKQVSWQWSTVLSKQVATLQSDRTRGFIAKVDQILAFNLTQKRVKKYEKNANLIIKILSEQLQHFDLSLEEYEHFGKIFFLHGAKNLIDQEIVDFFNRKKRRLEMIKSTYDNLLKAIKDKQKIMDYICDYQKAFLAYEPKPVTGHNLKDPRKVKIKSLMALKPLSKADIIRAIGYLPSSDYQKVLIGSKPSAKEIESNNKAVNGRRLEKTMENTLVEINNKILNNEIVDLSYLIPSDPKYKDSTVQRTNGETVVKEVSSRLLQYLIDTENKQKTMSDEKIVAKFLDPWGIIIARRTIANYRKNMGIGSSQERKQ